MGRHQGKWLTLLALAWPLALLAGLPAARGQTLPTLPAPAAPPSSTAVLASQLVAGLTAPPAPALGGPVVGGTRVALKVSLAGGASPREEALTAFLADAIEAKARPLAGFGRRVGDAGDATERWEVELAIKDGHLMATARRRVMAKNLWEVIAKAEGQVLATAYANVAIDLELRTLLGLGRREVRLDDMRVVPVTKKSAAFYRGARVLDCSVADLDGDRLPELTLLQTDAVRAARWSDGGFARGLGVLPLSELAASEAPLREPLGRLLPVTRPDGRRVLLAASSDRAEALVLGLGEKGLERLTLAFQPGWPLYVTAADRFVTAPWPRAIDSLEGGLTEARLGTATSTWIGAASRVYDLRAFAGDGKATLVAALVGGGIRLLPGGDNPGAGVASVVVDFDADGAFEIVTTSQSLEGPDRLGLARLPASPNERWNARALWTGMVSAPVTALCEGDVDRDGYREVIAATWDGRASELIVVVPR